MTRSAQCASSWPGADAVRLRQRAHRGAVPDRHRQRRAGLRRAAGHRSPAPAGRIRRGRPCPDARRPSRATSSAARSGSAGSARRNAATASSASARPEVLAVRRTPGRSAGWAGRAAAEDSADGLADAGGRLRHQRNGRRARPGRPPRPAGAGGAEVAVRSAAPPARVARARCALLAARPGEIGLAASGSGSKAQRLGVERG